MNGGLASPEKGQALTTTQTGNSNEYAATDAAGHEPASPANRVVQTWTIWNKVGRSKWIGTLLGQLGLIVNLLEKYELIVVRGVFAQLAPPLLLCTDNKAIEGATDENVNRDDV